MQPSGAEKVLGWLPLFCTRLQRAPTQKERKAPSTKPASAGTSPLGGTGGWEDSSTLCGLSRRGRRWAPCVDGTELVLGGEWTWARWQTDGGQ